MPNTIVPIPSMQIEEANIFFDMEVKSAEARELPDDQLVEIDTGGWHPDDPIDWGGACL